MKSKKNHLSEYDRSKIRYGNPLIVGRRENSVEVPKPIEVSVKPVEVAKSIEVPVKSVEVAKPIEVPVKPVEVAKKPKRRNKRLGKTITVYEKEITVLDAVCKKLSLSKSQAYKTSLRMLAGQLNIL